MLEVASRQDAVIGMDEGDGPPVHLYPSSFKGGFMRRYKQILLVVALVCSFVGITPRRADGQIARRWLAGPALIVPAKMIGPTSQQTFNTVSDIEMVDAIDGWATAYGNILQLLNGTWGVAMALPGNVTVTAVDLDNPTSGWIVGNTAERVPPYRSNILIMRTNGLDWNYWTDPVQRADGPTAAIEGRLHDIAAYPGGALAIGVTPSDVEFWTRPLVLTFDGTTWRDTTPPEWRYGSLVSLSMLNAGEGWATGLIGRPGGEGADAVRPVIWHYQNGAWTEEAMPAELDGIGPFGMGQIVMTNADQGWAVFTSFPGSCPYSRLLHRQNGAWSIVETEYIPSLTLGLIPGSNRGWASVFGCSSRGATVASRRMQFDNGTLTPDTTGSTMVPNVYGIYDDQHQWASAEGAMMRYSAEALPTDRVMAAPEGARYFPETGHTLAGEFRDYYESHGLEMGDRGVSARESLALFGYPVSEPFDEINPDTHQVLRVQYFERARFELHLENQPPYRVLLGRLAFVALHTRDAGMPRIPNPSLPPTETPGCRRFAETGYDICSGLLSYWQRNGGLPVFGLPITTAAGEISATDGNLYDTQWLERERLELHPELAGTPYEVLLGLLGSEELQRRGYLR
jgi:hypothetical protein